MPIKYILHILLFLLASCGDVKTTPPSTRAPEIETAGQEPLTLEMQLERLHKLKHQGQELRLIVGRKNDEEHGPLPVLAKGEWVFGDADISSKKSLNHPIQLTMDFDGGKKVHIDGQDQWDSPLNAIEDETFDQIILDYSVWKFMVHNLKPFAHQYQRMLKPGGKLYFEESHGGSTIELLPLSKGWDLRFCDNDPDCVTGIKKNPLAGDIAPAAYDEIAKRYQRFFTKMGFSSVVRHVQEPYVIDNRNRRDLSNFYEITK